MPSRAPPVQSQAADSLGQLAGRLRAQRQALGVSAQAAAEAAGLSRVTLHRIEKGEASVTMGSYLNVAAALGLALDFAPVHGSTAADDETQQAAALPDRIRLADFPLLRRLAWHLQGTAELTPEEALGLYERNWRHRGEEPLDPGEQALLQALVQVTGMGRLLV